MNEEQFRTELLNWYQESRRNLPWRDCEDPYKIWVSEIMLQQTRVDQAIPYYERFVKRFPDVYELAEADRQDVLKLWEGLGYYSRARNLHDAAGTVVSEHGGKLPDTWKEIIKLKGIGSYTASALLSIVYDKPYAVVDGNVVRVLSRFFGIEEDVRSSETKKRIQKLSNELLDPEQPGDFNQALMELGATVCRPDNPLCGDCPLQSGCRAYSTARTDEIPYKSSSKKRPHKEIGVGIIVNGKDEVLIALRPEDVMLGGLWEFPGGKQEKGETIRETVIRELQEELGVEVEPHKEPLAKIDHGYSHFTITLHAYLCVLKNGSPKAKCSRQINWVPVDELKDYPFPKANRKVTEELVSVFGRSEK